MRLKKVAITATMAAAVGLGVLGFGTATAQADSGWIPDLPPPGHIGQLPFVPPPGQLSHLPFVPPPGHWDKAWKWLP